MPPTEESQYTIYCKSNFDKIDRNFERLFGIIEGNGSDGIKGRLVAVEKTVESQEGRWKWIFGILAIVIAAVIVSIIV